MARRLTRRKMPEKDDFQVKERLKVEFNLNERTMLYLSKFFNKGIISRLDSIIARGKEADLYLADPGAAGLVANEAYVIMKLFRIETSTFFNMADYMLGDPRFNGIASSKHAVVNAWCKKEFGNLKIAFNAKVNVPMPYYSNGNVLAMQFIGTGSAPAPKLKDARLEDADAVLDRILADVKRLLGAGLVHADLSEYNVLMHNGNPYLIDFGQAVIRRHPNAKAFLERDIRNMLAYFSKAYEVNRGFEKTYEYIIGKADEPQ